MAPHATKLSGIVPALVSSIAASTMAQAPNPLQHRVDAELFPKAYGVLDNEHLLFPIDQGAWPVRIGPEHQLFVDDYLIASREHVTRQVHQWRKHPANPLMGPDRPWEGPGCVFQHVLRDEEGQRFRMWYGCPTAFALPNGVRVRQPTCYAESTDGVTWTKPELGICEYEGSRANNIVILTGGLFGIIHEPDEPDPQRRYKGLVWHDWRGDDVPPEGYYLFSSPDGLHWRQDLPEPVILNQNKTQPGVGDTSTFRRDPILRKYICDVKVLFRSPTTMRSRGMMESDDLIHWSRPRMTFYPDALDASDTQIYGHVGFVYESMWIGLLRVMHTQRVPDSYKQTTIEMTASRDGRHWTRVGRREEVLALGEPDAWDPHYHDPHTPPLLVGDELRLYYRSVPLRAPRDDPESRRRKVHQIGLATLKRDRFVSLDADDEPGMVVTRPLTFDGRALHVNAQVGAGGYVKAALQDRAGRPVAPWTLANCQAVTGDVLGAPVTWSQRDTVERPADQSLRIAFALKNARLFAFWIE